MLLVTVLLSALAASISSAELTQKGDLFVNFDGGISPRALPRSAPAPIGVRIEGKIKVPPGQQHPSLRGIEVALNRAGRLETTGLPRCPRHKIESGTPAEALDACETALVGAGGIVARTDLQNQQPTTVRGEILLFNGVDNGRPVIFAHIYQTEPTPLTRLVVFRIRRSSGSFGTVITGDIPPSVNSNGYLESIFLQLERRYSYRGRQRSYLSAACSAPTGFNRATFPFAKTSMTFEDGRTLSSTLVRSCRVK
ncbi:MAG TPA: hypothetical protein VGH58_07785 [Solirubrobacterales bacterium]